MKVVLDTNVIVSAILSPAGIPAQILSNILSEKLIIVYNNGILAEYIDVLGREKFNLNKSLRDLILEYIAKEGEFRIAGQVNQKFLHEDDRKFYELFKSGGIDYLVTGNTKHFPKEKRIVTPRSFVEKELAG